MILFIEALTITFAVITGITTCQCVAYTCSICAQSHKYNIPANYKSTHSECANI